MTEPAITLNVRGRARPQGSKTAFVNKYTGRAQMRESSTGLADWRRTLTIVAQNSPERPDAPIESPVRVQLLFGFSRPKTHYRTGKHSHELKAAAPGWVTSRAVGDIDKLSRAILDALTTAGYWRDDSQVAQLSASKTWTTGPDEAVIVITPLPDTELAELTGEQGNTQGWDRSAASRQSETTLESTELIGKTK